MRLLIVEDQKYPLMALKGAVRSVAPDCELDVSKCYSDVEAKIGSNSYDVILLDHRMPRNDVGDLESRDMIKFSSLLENIGYTLIPQIKARNQSTLVIGTSSLSVDELKGLPVPDYIIGKGSEELNKDLEKILGEVTRR